MTVKFDSEPVRCGDEHVLIGSPVLPSLKINFTTQCQLFEYLHQNSVLFFSRQTSSATIFALHCITAVASLACSFPALVVVAVFMIA